MNNQSLGEYIRDQRSKLDISLRELARRIGITAPFLSDIELGKRYPSDETLSLLAKEFGLAVEDLKKFDHRESLSDFKRLVEESPDIGFAFRSTMNKFKAGKLSKEELANLFKQSNKRSK